MRQSELDRAVARVDGRIRSHHQATGILLADPIDSGDLEADEHGPQVIDWDELAGSAARPKRWRPHHEPVRGVTQCDGIRRSPLPAKSLCEATIRSPCSSYALANGAGDARPFSPQRRKRRRRRKPQELAI